MKVLLLGAGYGTRLYPLTKDRPKPLLPVGGVAILQRIVDKLVGLEEIEEFIIVSNDRFFDDYSRWLDGYDCPKRIKLLNDKSTSDEDKIGAVGDIKFSIEEAGIDDDLFIIAGDNLFEFDPNRFIDFFKAKGNSIALKDMKTTEKLDLYSVVSLDEDSKIIDFEEKPPAPKTTLIAICMYMFKSKNFGLLDKYIGSGNKTDAPGYYIQWLVNETDVYGFVFDEQWFDIGDIDSYNQANEIYSQL